MQHSDVILERLLGLHPRVIDLSLDRVERLLADLGHPERRLAPVIHIAGTNGKGSVAAFCRAMLEAAGRGVHVYTSPHLVRFHERIRLGRPGGASALVAEDELAETLGHCERVNDGRPITFFEITTAAALLLFARHPADHVILETGLGGRLDATNVVERPAVTVITPVSIDHQHYLGDTIEQIAAEKAGILKRGVAGIVAAQPAAALDVIRRQAARLGSPLAVCNEDWHAYEQQGRMVYQDGDGLLDLPLPRLVGRHQIGNAGTAVAALRRCPGLTVEATAIEAGIVAADWPARMQRLGPGRLAGLVPEGAELWLDGGHNPDAGIVLAQAATELEERVPRPLVLVVGMMGGKDARGFLAPFAGLARRVVTLTIPGEANAADAGVLAETARALGFAAEPTTGLAEALVRAGEGPVAPRVLVCGSLHLAGRVLAAHGG